MRKRETRLVISGCGCLPIDPNGYYCPRCTGGEPCAIDPKQVEMCRRWIRSHCTPLKRVTTRAHSYSLKHVVERWTTTLKKVFKQTDWSGRAYEDSCLYISNGAFIKAAQLEGYTVRPSGINATFNMRIN